MFLSDMFGSFRSKNECLFNNCRYPSSFALHSLGIATSCFVIEAVFFITTPGRFCLYFEFCLFMSGVAFSLLNALCFFSMIFEQSRTKRSYSAVEIGLCLITLASCFVATCSWVYYAFISLKRFQTHRRNRLTEGQNSYAHNQTVFL